MQNDYRHYSIIVKPVGALCNLKCSYCYYLCKGAGKYQRIISDHTLEEYIKQTIAIHGVKAEIEFAWHGGEPTLAGIPFFQKAIDLQRKYSSGRKILNTLQTNGTLINEEWCRFFTDNNFRIGISIDGPERLHNIYRKDAAGNGTFSKVMDAVGMLKKHNVQFNTLTTVNDVNEKCGSEVYAFLRQFSDYMQFLPVVESRDDSEHIALPPGIDSPENHKRYTIAPFNVSAEGYGQFMCNVLECWMKEDIGKKFVQTIEAGIGNLLKRPAGLCVHESVCGHCAVVEQNGDVYRCDRFVFDQYRIGNITTDHLRDMMESNRAFGEYKLESLPPKCLHCDVVEMCFGGCPKDRLNAMMTLYGVERHNYLCKGYKMFFRALKNEYETNIRKHICGTIISDI